MPSVSSCEWRSVTRTTVAATVDQDATRKWESLIEVRAQEEQTRALVPVSRLMKVRFAFQYKPVPFCVCKCLRVKERDSHRVWRAWERADQRRITQGYSSPQDRYHRWGTLNPPHRQPALNGMQGSRGNQEPELRETAHG